MLAKLGGLVEAYSAAGGAKEKAGREVLQKMTNAYAENAKEGLWKSVGVQEWLQSVVSVALEEVEQATTTSRLEKTLAPHLLQLDVFSCYAQLDMSKGKSEVVYLPGEEAGGGGGAAAANAPGDEAEANVDLDENAMLLMMQLLMPWNQVGIPQDGPRE